MGEVWLRIALAEHRQVMKHEASDHLRHQLAVVEKAIEIAEGEMYLSDERSLGLAEASSAHDADFAQTPPKCPSLDVSRQQSQFHNSFSYVSVLPFRFPNRD